MTVEAGESTYTQVGSDVGLAGGLVFAAWCLVLLWRVLRCTAWLGRLRGDAPARPPDDILGVPVGRVLPGGSRAGGSPTPIPDGRSGCGRHSCQLCVGPEPTFVGSAHRPTVEGVRVRLPDLLVTLAVTGLLAFAVLHLGKRKAAIGAVLASPTLTPGALNPDVTQATIRSTICVRGWTTTVRPPSSYTSALKIEQLPRYG